MIGHIHHVGVVLPDADEALGFYRDTMGLTVTDDVTIEEQGVRGVLLGVGENEIELLQPTRDDTGVARYLDSRGPTLHHICFETDDIEGELERLKAANVDLIDEEPRDGIAGRIAFIHPQASHGVLIELAQTPDGSHVSPEKGFDHLAMTVADYEAAPGDVEAAGRPRGRQRDQRRGPRDADRADAERPVHGRAARGPGRGLADGPAHRGRTARAPPRWSRSRSRTLTPRSPATARPASSCRTRRRGAAELGHEHDLAEPELRLGDPARAVRLAIERRREA